MALGNILVTNYKVYEYMQKIWISIVTNMWTEELNKN
jgi:hypothetical protein